MNLRLSNLILLGLLALFGLCAGCATSETSRRSVRRFREADAANLILRFSRWDTIHVLRPDSREGGFLPILSRADLETHLDSHPVPRGMAVVILGFLFSDNQEKALVREWSELLSRRGFSRIVVVRTAGGDSVNGLPVVYDSLQ